MVAIPIGHPDNGFDFKEEAKRAAVNEACAGDDSKCDYLDPCVYCQALAKIIEAKLIRAFIAGQKSMQPTGD